jgi:hypothetical protein
MAANTTYENIDLPTLRVLKDDTLEQIRKLSAVGESHSINGRSTSLTSRRELLAQLADISRAITARERQQRIEAAGGTFGGIHSVYPDFSRRLTR